jgi:glyoxylase-like metal-dependent hydrolase (beta-lactamase superfamily II)
LTESQSCEQIRPGVFRFQTTLWQTNSLVVAREGDAVFCDPAFTPDEIRAIASHAEAAGASRSYVVVTHGDFDHVCGIPFVEGATVVAGRDTQERLQAGDAARELREASADWREDWSELIRVDRVAEDGERFRCGGIDVVAVGAAHHGVDGLAYLFPEDGVLCTGDFMSALATPALLGSLERMQDGCRTLIRALAEYDVELVVPGHGPALEPAAARSVAEADLEYLLRLEATVRQALASGLAPARALIEAYAVEPPRSSPLDFEVYGERLGSARYALRDLGGTIPSFARQA